MGTDVVGTPPRCADLKIGRDNRRVTANLHEKQSQIDAWREREIKKNLNKTHARTHTHTEQNCSSESSPCDQSDRLLKDRVGQIKH